MHGQSLTAVSETRYSEVPSGVVTFLFTDIEGSTKLWESHPEQMRVSLARHDALMRGAIAGANGHVFKTIGDAFCAAFARAPDGVEAVVSAQHAISYEPWPEETLIKVRMALHTGLVESRDSDYFGPPVNRVARLLSTAHGGQSLLSGATFKHCFDMLQDGVSLKDLGSHQLKDLSSPEQVYQILHPALPSDFPPIRSLSTHPNNLPQQLSSFIGREAETSDIQNLLKKHRLVTLIGAGGTGKTRLSLQAAANILERFPDGAWLVGLAPLSDEGLVASTVASELGLKEDPGTPVVQTLSAYLNSKQLLLVLDNCEHLLEATSRLANAVMQQCPGVHILATSREALGVSGEATYRVPPLSVPDPSRAQSPESLAHFDAVRLFVDRAVLVKTNFVLTNENAPALASICHRLDGIPLAIELAAARVRSMSVEDINKRLDQRFRLLTGGSRTSLPRQQTLRSLIDWSYDLLNEPEKLLLQRLSIFSGGWTLEAAEAICADGDEPVYLHPSSLILHPFEVLDLLTSLCDKSLVVADLHSGSARYRMLETVREYARDRLLEVGDEATMRTRQVEYYLSLAEAAEPHLSRPEQAEWLDRLEAEHDNMRAALDWCANAKVSDDYGLRLTGSLTKFWMIRGYASEGRRRCSQVLKGHELSAPSAYLAKALHSAGNLAYVQSALDEGRSCYTRAANMRRALGDRNGEAGSRANLASIDQTKGDFDKARQEFERTLAIFEALGDQNGAAISLTCLGTCAHSQGDLSAGREYLTRAIALNRQLGNRAAEANTLNNLGVLHRHADDETSARTAFEAALKINRELNNVWEAALNLVNIATCARTNGEFGSARGFLQEGMEALREVGDRRQMIGSLEEFAHLDLYTEQLERAALLFGAATALLEALHLSRSLVEVRDKEAAISVLRSRLGDHRLKELLDQGHGLTLEEAIELALDDSNV